MPSSVLRLRRPRRSLSPKHFCPGHRCHLARIAGCGRSRNLRYQRSATSSLDPTPDALARRPDESNWRAKHFTDVLIKPGGGSSQLSRRSRAAEGFFGSTLTSDRLERYIRAVYPLLGDYLPE